MKDNYTHIEVIVDKSGSMGPTAKDTIGSINSFIEKQKEVPGTASFRLTQFNHNTYPGEFYGSLKDVPPLTPETYQASGNTSLLDAVGTTITTLGVKLAGMPESERPSKVIVVIMTDGEENSPYPKFTRDQIFSMISHQKDVYKWEFMFLGANQDAIKVGTGLGVSRGATLNYATTGGNIGSTYLSVNRVIAKSRGGGASASLNSAKAIFTPEEIKAAVEPVKTVTTTDPVHTELRTDGTVK